MRNEIQPDAIPGLLNVIIGNNEEAMARQRLEELFKWTADYLCNCWLISEGDGYYEKSTRERLKNIMQTAQSYGLYFIDDDHVMGVEFALERCAW